MTDLVEEIRRRAVIENYVSVGGIATISQAEADRRTLLQLLDATREELFAATARLERLHAATEWGTPRVEWTYGSRAKDGPGRVIGFGCDERTARAQAAMPREGENWETVALTREVSAWREA